ncbi:hypothetical protein [Eubacterium sp. AF05-24]|uniref:hypothetical protein n=1 Tax=Eubacterium sp. AF05-24 TaxID=2996995 RepID=UPI0022DF8614|nr:hypothetical protein [Eubacterium sp. AF05-24]
MKKLLGGLLACLMMVSMSGCGSKEPETKDDVKTVGILIYANHPALESASKGLQNYLKEKGYDETKVKFVEKTHKTTMVQQIRLPVSSQMKKLI